MYFLSKQKKFQRLITPWADRLYGVALRQTVVSHTAEDWVQETFLRAWKDFNKLTDDIAVYAWLLKILDHVIADDIRREKRRHHLAAVINVDDKELFSHPCLAPGPFERTLQQQTSDQIMNAALKLPDEYRQVVLLRDIEGLSYQEVAYILDIPKGTVMSRLSRGRRILSSSLVSLKGTEDSSKHSNKLMEQNNE